MHSHAVIDPPARMDDMRVIAYFLGLVGDIEWIDADAMASDQARPKRKEVPLGAGSFQDILGVYAQPVTDQRDFVDQGDVDVALRILQHLGKLRDPDRFRSVGACRHDAL